jgi:hypothetical protein
MEPFLEELEFIPAFHAKIHRQLVAVEFIGISLSKVARSSQNCRDRIQSTLTGTTMSNDFGSREIHREKYRWVDMPADYWANWIHMGFRNHIFFLSNCAGDHLDHA